MSRLTDREKEILGILKNNPMIAQEELAERVGITRSSAAVHISNLTKKGYIMGRGYVFNDKTGVLVAGSVFVEVEAEEKSDGQSEVRITTGGTGYRIALSLMNLGVPTSFASSLGRDEWGEKVMGNLRKMGIDTRYLYIDKDYPTPKKVIIREDGVIQRVIADRWVLNNIGNPYINNLKMAVTGSEMLVIDAAVSGETFGYLTDLAREANVYSCVVIDDNWNDFNKIPVEKFAGLNLAVVRGETAEKITGMNIKDLDNGVGVGREISKLGLETVVVVTGELGVALVSQSEEIILPLPPGQVQQHIQMDKLTAGLLTNIIRGYNFRQNLRLALAGSNI